MIIVELNDFTGLAIVSLKIELKNWIALFYTVPYEGYDSFDSHLSFGSLENMELIVMLYNTSLPYFSLL